MGEIPEKIASARERTLVICPVETGTGLANVDGIAAVDGVDCVRIGHADLANFLGSPGQFGRPKFRQAVTRVVAAAGKHPKAAGFLALDRT